MTVPRPAALLLALGCAARAPALRPGACEGCPAEVGRGAAALQLPASCARGLVISSSGEVAGEPAWVLDCREPAGAGAHQRLILVSRAEAGLRVWLTVDAGAWAASAPGQPGDCGGAPVGALELRDGGLPWARIPEPPVHDGRGFAWEGLLLPDPAIGELVPTCPGARVEVDARAACRGADGG